MNSDRPRGVTDMPGEEPVLDKETVELQQHRIWAHVEERLDKRSARTRAAVGLVAAFLGLVGIPSLYFALQTNVVSTVKKDVEKQTQHISEQVIKAHADLRMQISTMETQLTESKKLGEESTALTNQLNEAKSNADKLMGDLKSQNTEVEELLKSLDKRKKRADEMMARLQTNLDKVRELSEQLEATERSAEQKLASLARYSERLDSLQRQVQETLPTGGGDIAEPIAAVELESSDLDALYVHQDVKNLGESGGRTRRLLTYSIMVDDSKTLKDPQDILDTVDKVVYKLDPKWFSQNEYVRSNRDDNFQFSVTVWGVTEVSVEIYVRDREKIVRTAMMSLFDPNKF